jgi:hypothetical protein
MRKDLLDTAKEGPAIFLERVEEAAVHAQAGGWIDYFLADGGALVALQHLLD